MKITRITPLEVKEWMDHGKPILFLDIRNSTDWSQSDVKLPGAMRVPIQDLEQKLDQLPQDTTIVAYCT